MKFFRLACLLVFFRPALCAQKAAPEGSVAGAVVDRAGNRAVEYATVTLKNKATGEVVRTGVTDAKGAFSLEKIPFGDYQLVYSLLGADDQETAAVTVDARHRTVDLGRLTLAATAVKMEQVEVKAKPTAFLNTIDRKVYNVGKEIQTATGTASDLLQNIPSVQVDIDGNVSLRGSDNVMILINGRTSALMGRSRAEVLQQLPADSIERIEVITNPSAKYKPDGTAGIINIALKRKHEPGYSGTLNVSAGNQDRFNASLAGNYNPGKYNLFGSYSTRQDDRERTGTDTRTLTDAATGVATTLVKKSTEQARPLSRIGRAGADFSVDEHNKLGATGSFHRRTQVKRGTDYDVSRDSRGGLLSDYDRTRYDPEVEEDREFAATYQHTFPQEDRELNLELKSSSTDEVEDNHFVNSYRTPFQPAPAKDNTLIRNAERNTEAIIEYVHPIDDHSKLEAGYTLSVQRFDADFSGEFLDLTSGAWTKDLEKSNRFKRDETIHAFYVTYARSWDKIGLLAGLRPEQVYAKSTLMNTGATIPQDYSRIYPSLHLAYRLTDKHEVQLNYSHRVHRPDSDELNPFPEYADPFNLRAGNPRLLPEDIHSFEAGYGFKTDDVNITSSVYHRYLYHGFTSITRDLGNSVLLSTRENLAESRSTGVELTTTADLGRVVVNFSSNAFFNTIDASNLGYTARKSDISWIAKLGSTFHFSKTTLFQLNTNYISSRLTPQGTRRPWFVANAGMRQDILQKKAAIVLTVSDLFNTMKEASALDTPLLRQDVVRRRSARIVYLGFIYNFGKPPKKSKEDGLKFDNSI